MSENCFHCGLPADGVPFTAHALNKDQPMCCAGCKAVCDAIVASGNEDYYRYREQDSIGPNEQVPAFLDQVDLYDQEEIQRECVRSKGDTKKVTLLLEDIRCTACLWLNEQHLRQLPGITSVEIDRVAHLAHIEWLANELKLSDILRAIATIGYRAHPIDPNHRSELDRDTEYRSNERLIFAGILGMVVMHFALSSYIMGPNELAPPDQQPLWIKIGRWTGLMVSLAILVWPGREFFAAAWRGLRHKQLVMDLPIVIGLTLAWTASAWSTIAGTGAVYFDSIAMFVFLVLVARRLELGGRRAAAQSRDALSLVIPRTAIRLDNNGKPCTVALHDLAPGDSIRVAPGEALPTDVLLLADAEFDESALTGESKPVARPAQSHAPAGALNVAATLTAEVLARADESAADWVSRATDKAAGFRPAYVQTAERIVPYFIVTVLLLSLGTLLVWSQLAEFRLALAHAISVLIVTCPCALALASPTASALAIGRALHNGLVPRKASAMEQLASVDTIVFDKTGTLTLGQAELVDTHYQGDHEQLDQITHALTAASPHPLSKALHQTLLGNNIQLSDESLVTGSGVQAILKGQQWRLGRADYVLGGESANASVQQAIEAYEQQGRQLVAVGTDNEILALYALRDRLREDAHDTITDLASAGIKDVHILSGDSELAVSQLAEQLGIEHHAARQSPQDKLAYLRTLQAQGKRVLMVGDGLNDLLVLQGADLSMALGDATELARYHSDWVLLSEHLGALVTAHKLAKRTRKIIIQNLSWAVAYNIVAVPLAMAGFMPPWAAAIGMSTSSIIVVINSMRLKTGANS